MSCLSTEEINLSACLRKLVCGAQVQKELQEAQVALEESNRSKALPASQESNMSISNNQIDSAHAYPIGRW